MLSSATNPETEDQSLDSGSVVIDVVNARVDDLIHAILHDFSSDGSCI